MNPQHAITSWLNFLQQVHYEDWIRAGLMLLLGYFIARGSRSLINRLMAKRFNQHVVQLWARISYNLILWLFIITALRQVGFNFGVLLGAAGIFTVAFGFASQTSASNLISGLFLLGERSFVAGDKISVNGVTGRVLSVDLLSTKLRTSDNVYVRIPNESLIKSQLANLSRFPTRRLDLTWQVIPTADLASLRTSIDAFIAANRYCLKEPSPSLTAQAILPTGVNLLLSVWVNQNDLDAAQNSLVETISQHLASQKLLPINPLISTHSTAAGA